VKFLGRYRRSKNDDVALNPVPEKTTAAAAAAAPTTATSALSAADKKDKSSGGGLLRKMVVASKKEKLPPNATRDEFSMASGSTWTTKATEQHHSGMFGDDQTDAAGNPVNGHVSPRRGGDYSKRDGAPKDCDDDITEVQRGGGVRATARSKIKSALLERNKADETNIAVIYNTYGEQASKVCNLVLRENLPVPKGPLDVIVQVDASTVSLQDCIIRRGMWYQSVPLPATPGFDAVGTIIQLGEEVSEVSSFKVGDRVAALVRTGGNARYVNVPAASLVKIPLGVDATQAACIVSTYMTAFQALDLARASTDQESSLEGKKVLVTGGNGPVGRAVIELARLAKADAIYATAYGRDHPDLESMGAIALPFSSEDWLPKVQGSMDIVIDGVCVDNYASPHAALNSTGQLICIGMTSKLYSSKGPGMLIGGYPAAARWASIKACFMTRTTTYELWSSFYNEPELFKSDLEYLFSLAKGRAIKPSVSKLIPLSEVADAQERLETGNVPPGGQIVCIPWKKFVYVTSKKHKTDTESVVTPKY